MNNPNSSKAYRQAMSNTNRESREWLERMAKDDYVRDVLLTEYDGTSNWMTVWVLTDIFTVHAYSIPYRNKCKPTYMGNIEQWFQNHTRRSVGYRSVGFWSYTAMWNHNMKCFRRRNQI